MGMNACLRLRTAIFAALTAATLCSACGHAELVVREPTGGQVALKGNRRAALQRAHEDMATHCGADGYRVTREETVVLGTNKSTVAQMGAGPQGLGGQFIQSESVEKETRLTYVCGGGSPDRAGLADASPGTDPRR